MQAVQVSDTIPRKQQWEGPRTLAHKKQPMHVQLEGTQRLHTSVSGLLLQGAYREASHPAHRPLTMRLAYRTYTDMNKMIGYTYFMQKKGCMSFGP